MRLQSNSDLETAQRHHSLRRFQKNSPDTTPTQQYNITPQKNPNITEGVL